MSVMCLGNLNNQDTSIMNICTEDKIVTYIEYLKSEHHLFVSIHFSEKYTYLFSAGPKLFDYNIHTNPYCFKMKSKKENHDKCLKCQSKTLKKCSVYESFIGKCYADVYEYIHRIYVFDEVAGFISISGYRDEKIPFGKDKDYDENMKPGNIPVSLFHTLIAPLAIMIEKMLIETEREDKSNDIYFRVLHDLNEHHTVISLTELAQKFCVSKSYISHMFKKRNGHTIKEYGNILKIKDAKILLETSKLSVTEIGLSVGFNNFSYFIHVFKQYTGLTPLRWRKERTSH